MGHRAVKSKLRNCEFQCNLLNSIIRLDNALISLFQFLNITMILRMIMRQVALDVIVMHPYNPNPKMKMRMRIFLMNQNHHRSMKPAIRW